MQIPRDQLYAEVWAEPLTKVAARHGTYLNILARICQRLKVSRPPRATGRVAPPGSPRRDLVSRWPSRATKWPGSEADPRRSRCRCPRRRRHDGDRKCDRLSIP